MRIVILTTDNREQLKDYDNPIPHFGTAPEALLQGFALLPEVEVHVVSCVRKAMVSPEKIADNIWYHPLLVPKIGWMSTAYQGCIRDVRKKVREINPDIVHGQGTERDCSMTAIFSGYPNVLTIHGNMRRIAEVTNAKLFSYGWLNAHLEAFVLPRTLGVVCITSYTQRAVEALARKTWIVPNATDARFYEIERNESVPPVILVVGSVCNYKNQNAFIRALDPLAAKHSFRVLFLGRARHEDPYGAEFFELLQGRPWCEYVGFVDRKGLRKHLAEASMLALPSIEDNCPMAVLEAMAAGVPVIGGNVGGVPDLITNNVNGLLCDPFEKESMAGAVQCFLESPQMARKMAATARETATERYHPRHVALRHLEIYREALKTA